MIPGGGILYGRQFFEGVVGTAGRKYGGLNTLFNNAGIEQPITATADLTEEQFDRMCDARE